MKSPPAVAAGPEMRVIVAAPTRRDGEVTCELLGKEGVECSVCHRLEDLADELKARVGAVVLTDRALRDPAMQSVVASLQEQPAWSDVPILLLTSDRVRSPTAVLWLRTLSNVTLLDLPSSTPSLVSAVKSALRARQRQYQIRDQMLTQQIAEQALRRADRRKDEFLATLAHELRNPLAAIRNGLDVVIRSPEEVQRTARMVGMIDRQSRMLVKLIDDLMDVSRISTGKVVLQKQRMDLRSVLESGLEAGQTVFDASRHDIRLDLPSHPVWIDGDASRLAQVLGNLINNAGKYTPDGGRITIELREEAGDAVVRVTDTGVGIPAEHLEQVFEMFTQVDRTMNRARGGLGIGLSLVRELVQLHGGTVSARSDGVDRGSTFTITLPAQSAPASDAANAPGSLAGRMRLKVLVIDDNQDVADGLAALLGIDGHDVRTAYDAHGGLEQVALFEPDLVFCDIGMPVMTGHDFARQLRSDANCKVGCLVAVTGWGTPEDKRLSAEAGFDVHLTKPVDPRQLEEVLARF
ncbi:MAG: ATP-binding protein [Caldimonas sp.]